MNSNALSPTSTRSSTKTKPSKQRQIMKTSIHFFLFGILCTLVFLGCSGPAGTPKYEERAFGTVHPDPSGKNSMSFDLHARHDRVFRVGDNSVTAGGGAAIQPSENYGE